MVALQATHPSSPTTTEYKVGQYVRVSHNCNSSQDDTYKSDTVALVTDQTDDKLQLLIQKNGRKRADKQYEFLNCEKRYCSAFDFKAEYVDISAARSQGKTTYHHGIAIGQNGSNYIVYLPDGSLVEISKADCDEPGDYMIEKISRVFSLPEPRYVRVLETKQHGIVMSIMGKNHIVYLQNTARVNLSKEEYEIKSREDDQKIYDVVIRKMSKLRNFLTTLQQVYKPSVKDVQEVERIFNDSTITATQSKIKAMTLFLSKMQTVIDGNSTQKCSDIDLLMGQAEAILSKISKSGRDVLHSDAFDYLQFWVGMVAETRRVAKYSDARANPEKIDEVLTACYETHGVEVVWEIVKSHGNKWKKVYEDLTASDNEVVAFCKNGDHRDRDHQRTLLRCHDKFVGDRTDINDDWGKETRKIKEDMDNNRERIRRMKEEFADPVQEREAIYHGKDVLKLTVDDFMEVVEDWRAKSTKTGRYWRISKGYKIVSVCDRSEGKESERCVSTQEEFEKLKKTLLPSGEYSVNIAAGREALLNDEDRQNYLAQMKTNKQWEANIKRTIAHDNNLLTHVGSLTSLTIANGPVADKQKLCSIYEKATQQAFHNRQLLMDSKKKALLDAAK